MRILCLHGMGTSAAVLEAQLGPIVASLEADGHEFVFLDGLLECATDNDIRSIFPEPYLCYYTMPVREQVLVAQQYVRDVIEDEGPFDGVIGFSQGAALAASLMLENMKSSSQHDLFSFCVFMGASLPFDLDNNGGLAAWLKAKRTGINAVSGEFDGEINKDDPPGFPSNVHSPKADDSLLGRYHPLRTSLRIGVPTLHIIGEKDPYKGQGKALANLTKESDSKVLYHKEGHCIPREYTFQLKAINAINATINRAMFYRH